MLGSPTDLAKSRRSSHADHSSSTVPPFSSLGTRRLASRQSSTATGYHEAYPIEALSSIEKQTYWGWTGHDGYTVPYGRRFHAAISLKNEVFVFGGEYRSEDERSSTAPRKTLLNDLVAFNVVLQEWREVCPPSQSEDVPKPRKGHSLSVWGSNIILFGGVGSHSYLNDVWIYSTDDETTQPRNPHHETSEGLQNQALNRSNRWTRLATTVTSDSCPNARRISKQSTVEGSGIPSFGTNTTEIPPPRAYHSAVVHDDSLYVYGGFGFSSQCQEAGLWKLDLHSHKWTPIYCTGLRPGRRYGHIACCFQSTMYVFGGQVRSCLNDNDVYKLNMRTLEWTMAASRKAAASSGRNRTATTKRKSLNVTAPCPRTYHAGALLEPYERWLVHGGSNETTTFGDLYEFNLLTEKWQALQCRSPVPLEGHGLAIVPTGVTFALMSVGGAPAGSVALSAPALRLDILVPSPSVAARVRVEDLLLPSVALSPLMEHARKPALLAAEVTSFRALQTKQQEEAKSRKALVEKLSVENQDLRLQLEDLTKKLETSMKDSIGRSTTVPVLEPTKLTPRPQDGSSYGSSRSHHAPRQVCEDVAIGGATHMTKAIASASPRLDAAEQVKLRNMEPSQSGEVPSARMTLHDREHHRSSGQFRVSPNSSNGLSAIQDAKPRDTKTRPTDTTDPVTSTPTTTTTTASTTTPSTTAGPSVSSAGVDIGLQAGRGKIKLNRSRRRTERRADADAGLP